MQATVLSGIQPSGQLSLGNYLGAIRHHAAASADTSKRSFFSVVDLHAITVRQDPAKLREQTYSVAAWYLAAGLDISRATLFVQSQVSAHSELGWLLNTFTQMGELERMTQFKDKAARHKQNINAGLFTYPALMAADILLYNTTEVPVGDDQKQHLELARDIAIRFNNIYGDIFVVPEVVIPKVAARVMDLQDPTSKMSKSIDGQGTVFLGEDLKKAEKKLKRAVTDNVGAIHWDRELQPGVTNLLGIYAACTGLSQEATVQHFIGKGYGDLKTAVAAAVLAELEPLQERYQALMSDKAELDRVFKEGASQATAVAAATLARVKDAMGFVSSH